MGVKALTAATNNPLKHKAVQIQTPYMPPLPPMDPKEVSPYFLNQAYKKFNRTSKSLSRNLPPHLLPNPVATLPLLPPFKDDMVAQPLANVTTQPQAFYDLTRAFSEETLISFRSSLAKLTDAKKKAAQKAGLSRGSIEYGHRAVAFEATLNARLQQSIEDAFHNVIQDLEEKLGKEEAKRRIEENSIYIRHTMHPTEGQNLRAIAEKDRIIKVQTLSALAEHLGEVNSDDVVKLARLYKQSGYEQEGKEIIATAKSDGLPDIKAFSDLCDDLLYSLVESFFENPIHHVTKMTAQDECNMLIYHLDRCKKAAATIVSRNPDTVLNLVPGLLIWMVNPMLTRVWEQYLRNNHKICSSYL